jgi:hypothetical protein
MSVNLPLPAPRTYVVSCKLMKKTAFLFLLLLITITSTASSQPADSAASDTVRRNRLLPAPVINYTPETSLILGVSALYTFYRAKDRITRPSFLFTTGIYTLNRQWITDLYFNIWSEKNLYHYLFEVNYIRFNYFFYGIGNHTRLRDEMLLDQEKFELMATVERRLHERLYGGIDVHYKRDQYPGQGPEILPLAGAAATQGGIVPRAGVSLIYDSRDLVNYPSRGHYLKANYSHTLPFISRDFDFYRVTFESRHFKALNKKNILGLNLHLETVQGRVPFFELRQLGSTFNMRGYYMGRFRDKNLATVQMEYRWQAFNRIGFVAFGGAGRVFDKAFTISGLKPNYGVGVRYFYDKASGLNIRLDYGLGEKIPGEKQIGNFYLFVGEAF